MPPSPKLWKATQWTRMLAPCEYLQKTRWAAKHCRDWEALSHLGLLRVCFVTGQKVRMKKRTC